MNANLGKLAVGEVSPMMIVALRWIGTVLIIYLLGRRHLTREWPVLKPHLGFLCLMGALGLTAFNGLFYLAAHTTSAINLGIIQGAIPMFVLLGSFFIYRNKVSGLQVAGIALTLIGVAIATTQGVLGRLATLSVNDGDILMVVACIFYAGYSVMLLRCPKVHPLALFLVFSTGALLACIPLVVFEMLTHSIQWPTPKGWIIVGMVVLFPSVIAHLCYINGVKSIGPDRAGIFLNLVPIFAAIIAVIFVGEQFQVFHAIAMILVLSGIGLSEISKRIYTGVI